VLSGRLSTQLLVQTACQNRLAIHISRQVTWEPAVAVRMEFFCAPLLLVIPGLRSLYPTAVTRVRSRVWSSGICGGQSGAGAGFLRVLQFPLPIFIPPIAPQSPSPIIWGWYNRPEVAAVQGTESHPTSNKEK
jgi:hypothetical protein